MQVVVTGAGGRTGALICKNILENSEQFSVVGTVRSKKASNKATTSAGLTDDNTIEFDLAAAAAAADGDICASTAGQPASGLAAALQGAEALVICTSAVPQIKYSSLIGVIAGKLVGRRNMPSFTWKKGEKPEQASAALSVQAHPAGTGTTDS